MLLLRAARSILVLALAALLSVVVILPDASARRRGAAASAPSRKAPAQVTASETAPLLRRLETARRTLASIPVARIQDSALVLQSLEREAQRLFGLLRARRPSCLPEPEVQRFEAAVALTSAGKPFHHDTGVHRLAYRSPLDGKLHPFLVYVPEGYSPTKSYPLVVMLHGMASDPLRDLGRLFGVPDSELPAARLSCDRPRLPSAPPLVVAPTGFGDALFRVVGEVDVTAVVRLTMRAYRVDPSRVTITGLSMGGTGAAEIAFQHPDRYAGIVALCGYYDRRQDSSIQGEPLLDWEKHLMSVHSPIDWASNGHGTPLVLIHGTQDGPGRAKRLDERYRELGQKAELELYPRGHDVWVPGYDGGRALRMLARFHKGRSSERVVLVTGRPRIRRAAWVRIDRFQDHTRWARVQGQLRGGLVEVSTENVAQLHLDPAIPEARRGQPVRLHVDGTELSLPPPTRGRASVDLVRQGAGWELRGKEPKEGPQLVKRTGLSGPIEDLYYEPVVVVYGTGQGRAAELRRVATSLAGYRKRVTLSYRVLPDRQYRPALAREAGIILIGNEQDNSVLARLGPRLPLRVQQAQVLLGGKTQVGPNIGATFIYPNPDAPEHYLRVVGGTSLRWYKLFEMLPVYLPDYVVFDEGMATKHPKPVLGAGRSLIAGGYFDESWQLSAPPVTVRATPATRSSK